MNTQKIVKDWVVAYRSLIEAYNTLVALEEEYTALNVGGVVLDSDTQPLGFDASNYTASVANWQTIRTAIEDNDAFIREVGRGEV